MTAPRRRKGEGSVSRWHRPQDGCPPTDPTTGERPEHACKARYRARVWVTTVDGSRVRKTVYGTTEREVLGKVKTVTVEEGNRLLMGARAMKVSDWLDLWLADYGVDLKVNTRKTYESKIRLYLKPHLGKHRLDKLTEEHVLALYRELRRQGLSTSSVRLVHGILSRSLTVAEKRGKVARNVCRLLDAPQVDATLAKRHPLTVEDAQRVLAAAGGDARWWVALLAGLRQGEALALRWRDLHLDVPEGEWPYLVVRESLTYSAGDGGFVFDTPKSRASTNREVPLVPPVVERLRAAKDAAFAQGATDNSLVFPNPRKPHLPLIPNQDYRHWKALLVEAGVEHAPPHTCRNTCAALLELAGVPPRVVATILGHANVDMTFHYQQGNRRSLGQAAEALAGFYLAALDEGHRGNLRALPGGQGVA